MSGIFIAVIRVIYCINLTNKRRAAYSRRRSHN